MLKLAKTAPLPNWARRFDTSIPIQNGKPLSTLRDAATFITMLPKSEQQATSWRTAAELLMMVAERGGDPVFARIAMLKALQHREPQAMTPRRRRAKTYSIIR